MEFTTIIGDFSVSRSSASCIAANVLQAIVFIYRQAVAVCAEKIAFEAVSVGNPRRNDNLEVSNDDLLSQRYW